jgi:uncharacterized delta-60 repeat protein
VPNSGLGFISSGYSLNGGSRDVNFTEFDTYSGFNGTVTSIAIQPDGKIICGGGFTTFNTTTFMNRIVRLNSDGTRDFSFFTNFGFNNDVNSIAIQPDGKIICGGLFTAFDGTAANRIVRLNSDGTRDTEFTTNTGLGFNNEVRSIAIQPDGKILIGGFFTIFNGTTSNRIVRLNSDGTTDTEFTTNISTGFNSGVTSFAIQSDGKIIIGGVFTTLIGGTANRIVRLNSDGTRDFDFTTNNGSAFGGFSSVVRSIVIQSDDKIICAGSLPTFNGTTVNGIARLNSNGSLDTAFATNTGTGFGVSSETRSIVIQSDGKILIGGFFNTFNGATVNHIACLNSNGTRDNSFTTNGGTGFNTTVNAIEIRSDGVILVVGNFSSFNQIIVNGITGLNQSGTRNVEFLMNTGVGFNGTVTSTAIQPDGKIICGGTFTNFNSTNINRIARLNSDGSLDTAFATNIGTGFNSTVISIAIQSDGKIICGGYFTSFNGATAIHIVRLNSDGTRDTTFTTNTETAFNDWVFSIAIQSDGKIICGGYFTSFNGATVNGIVRLNSDGTRDTTFTTNTGTAFDGLVQSLAVQSDGKLVIGGGFTTFNGVTVNRIVRLNSDGTRDTTFTTNTGTGFTSITFSTVNSVKIQSDDKIVIVGDFTHFNGVSVNRIVRLNSDGTTDINFRINTNSGFNGIARSIAIQADGKIIIVGDFGAFNGVTVFRIVRLNSNGTRDTDFTVNTGTSFNGSVYDIGIQSDGKAVVVGAFTQFSQVLRSRIVRIGGTQ